MHDSTNNGRPTQRTQYELSGDFRRLNSSFGCIFFFFTLVLYDVFIIRLVPIARGVKIGSNSHAFRDTSSFVFILRMIHVYYTIIILLLFTYNLKKSKL